MNEKHSMPWPLCPTYPCDQGLLLLRIWANSEPAIAVLLPQLTSANLNNMILNLSPMWRVYSAHISECQNCSGDDRIDLNASLADITLFN